MTIAGLYLFLLGVTSRFTCPLFGYTQFSVFDACMNPRAEVKPKPSTLCAARRHAYRQERDAPPWHITHPTLVFYSQLLSDALSQPARLNNSKHGKSPIRRTAFPNS
ncbi:hypothetical protein BC827DRAFT_517258 [Russula dissimulans]|nr:hypothetical protein BC827DRAFT_517258 [Russula dissimulans]